MTFVPMLLVAMTALFSLAQDQRPIEIPSRAQGAGSSRLGGPQFKLIRTSLKLTEEQTGQFESLIETYKARVMEEAMALLGNIDEMQQVSNELKAARTAKDAKRVEELDRRMRDLRPETRPTNEFYQSLAEILDEQQKLRLPKLREMLKGKGGLIDMRLKPRQVVRAAESLGLSREQADAIRRLQDSFRKNVRGVPRNDESAKETLLDQLVVDIRALLSKEQAGKFEARLDKR
jgi:hypothetical protein